MRVVPTAVLVLLSTSVQAQNPPDLPSLAVESFEVVSIKPNHLDTRPTGGMQPTGRLNIHATTVAQLLTFAYNGLIVPERMGGISEWAQRERYDIVATPARDVTDGRAYFRGLLRDRFRVRSQVESREMAVYVMTVRAGGFGPGLWPTRVDCNDEAAAEAQQKPDEPKPCSGGYMKAGDASMSWATMNALATLLSTQLGRPVINRTNLDGRYDVKMTWSPSLTATAGDNPNDNRAGLFTAVQEQLGSGSSRIVSPLTSS
jgi:uncharacterized protein (TIGR03435 family)